MLYRRYRDGRFDPRPCSDWPEGLILYDGACVLCSSWVRFVILRDPVRRFRFVSIQSETGRRLAADLGIDPDDPETNAVVLQGTAFFKSDAALAVASHLGGLRWMRYLGVLPRPVRDWLYDRIARNRYRWFGRFSTCFIPPADWADRFIDGPGQLRSS